MSLLYLIPTIFSGMFTIYGLFTKTIDYQYLIGVHKVSAKFTVKESATGLHAPEVRF